MKHYFVGIAVAVLCATMAVGQTCPGDLNGDGAVTINEIITSVDAALSGCPPTVTPTATPTINPTANDFPTPVSTPTPNPLVGLSGNWTFAFKLRTPFVLGYFFSAHTTVDGKAALIALDVNQFVPCLERRIGCALTENLSDLGVVPRRAFGMLHIGSGICDFFEFDRSGDTVVGEYLPSRLNSDGTCGLINWSYPLAGIRTEPNLTFDIPYDPNERTDELDAPGQLVPQDAEQVRNALEAALADYMNTPR